MSTEVTTPRLLSRTTHPIHCVLGHTGSNYLREEDFELAEPMNQTEIKTSFETYTKIR